jgi:hypothetical protein
MKIKSRHESGRDEYKVFSDIAMYEMFALEERGTTSVYIRVPPKEHTSFYKNMGQAYCLNTESLYSFLPDEQLDYKRVKELEVVIEDGYIPVNKEKGNKVKNKNLKDNNDKKVKTEGNTEKSQDNRVYWSER